MKIKSEKDREKSYIIKALSFDGKQSWITYHKQFKAAAAPVGWLDVEKFTAFCYCILSLPGAAIDIFRIFIIRMLKPGMIYGKIFTRFYYVIDVRQFSLTCFVYRLFPNF